MRGFIAGMAVVVALSGEVGATPLRREFRWEFEGETHRLSMLIHNEVECRSAYDSLPHGWSDELRYLSNYPCDAGLRWLAGRLRDRVRRAGYSTLQAVNFVLAFARSIPYTYDQDSKKLIDYVRYPYETILDGTGDCEDHALVFAAIMSHWCLDVVLLHIPRHVAVGINDRDWPEKIQGTAYLFNQGRYLYCEATGSSGGRCAPAKVGETPPLSNSAPNQYHARIVDVPSLCTFSKP